MRHFASLYLGSLPEGDFAQQVFACVGLFAIGLWFLYSAISNQRSGETVLPRFGTDYEKRIRVIRHKQSQLFWALISIWYAVAASFAIGAVVLFLRARAAHAG